MSKKVKIALVRGDSLKEQEAHVWETLGDQFETTAFCARKNLFPVEKINLPIVKLPSTSDNFFLRNIYKYGLGQYKRMFGLEKLLSNFDIVHTVEVFNYYTLQAVRAKQKNPKLKIVANFVDNTFGRFEYNYWPGFSYPPTYWRKKISDITRETIKNVDVFLAISKYSAELLKDLGAKPEQVKVVYPGLVLGSNDESLLDRYNLRGKNFYLTVSRLVWEKGVYDVLYAWKLYCSEKINHDQSLVIIGDGREYKNIKRLISEFKLQSSVLLIKNASHEEITPLYRHARAFILASLMTRAWQEQLGYVLVEAITEDCPVISTRSGAIPEVVDNAGILVSPGNPIELKNALIEMGNDGVYKTLKENCAKVKQKFSLKHFQDQLVEIYQSLI